MCEGHQSGGEGLISLVWMKLGFWFRPRRRRESQSVVGTNPPLFVNPPSPSGPWEPADRGLLHPN